MNKIKKATMVVLLLTFVLSLSMYVYAATSSTKKSSREVIKEGVKIENVDVSDMTAAEAKKKVSAYVKDKTNVDVEITVSDTVVKTSMSKLGYKWTNKSVIEDAIGVGKSGNVIKRYKDDLDLKNQGIELELELGIKKEDLKKNLKQLCGEYNIEAKNASLKLTSSGFSITPEKTGVEVDYDVTVDGMYKYITEKWDGKTKIKYEAKTKVSSPKYTTEDCKKVSSTPMSTYYTNFTVGAAYDNRNNNIKNGAEKLDGILLYPGESYSLNEHLAPWTAENGWYPAGTYVDGGVADSYGGGICQVSSTLYNALLMAELKIVERYPHSMAVNYVPLSADAALAGDYKDLVFENNTDAPIYIQSIYSSGGTLTFNVYGHDTRDSGHKVEYVSKTIKTIPVKTNVKNDSSKPKGYQETTNVGHTGYVAELWKVTYEDGVEKNRELVHTSTYAMSPTTVVKGTGGSNEKSTKEKTTGEKTSGEKGSGEKTSGEKSTTKKSDEKVTKKESATTKKSTTDKQTKSSDSDKKKD